ncbi:glycosyltransferase [Kocuria sp.]|uniref:glycosyltransferase n=1 Tax=Kocuria sp. TaxID=1871328 RepID=UPI0026DC6FF7|nr:glycosyltransferase [Kocuria sp.]MDO4920180.1 glycosyltransferase [Kocuria sp.]
MKVAVSAIGSRGDVVPFAHLADRFAAAGHEVTVVTHESARDVLRTDARVIPVASDPHSLMAGPAGRAAHHWTPWELNRSRDLFADFLHSGYAPAREALRDADVLVASTFSIAAVHAALQQGVPVVRAHMWPEYPGLDGPMPLLPHSGRAPVPARRAARRAVRRVEPYLGGVAGRWRRGRLHLSARHPVGLTTATLGTLYAFSPHMLPAPPREGTVTGWWTGPEDRAALSAPVADLLSSGDWVYLGFGSIQRGSPAAVLDAAGEACERAGVRAVAQLGDLRGPVHPRIHCIGDQPHEALFRRVRAAVHHGGAGTTAAAVRAGVPSVVVPHFADQFYWGARLHALGVAPRPLRRGSLSGARLAPLLREALEPAVGARAELLAERVRGEDGCGRAVAQVEQWLAPAGPR